jgi:hypothetical protein
LEINYENSPIIGILLANYNIPPTDFMALLNEDLSIFYPLATTPVEMSI